MKSKTQEASKRNVGSKERFVSLMAGGALAGFGTMQRSWAGAGLALIGAGLLYRGASGQCAVRSALKSNRPERVERTLTIINKSPEEVYEFWRKLDHLPAVIEGLESVRAIDDRRSHWVAKGPAGITIEWDAEIVNDRRGHLIEWRSLPGSAMEVSGIVRFKRKPGRGTKIHLSMNYVTPGGKIGEAIAERLGVKPEQRVDEGLGAFREALERT